MKKQLFFICVVLFLQAGYCILPAISSAQVIDGGGRHSVGLCIDGTVRAWGWNNYGELGNGNYTDSDTSVQVTSLTGIVAITAAYAHSLALAHNGKVWAWGNNTSGELGTGNTGGTSDTAALVTGLRAIIAIGGGQNHSIALKNDGTVWTWGSNSNGQLGNGTINNSDTPLQVTALTGIIAVAAGNAYSLALKNDGTVWSWGQNPNGELGNGNYNESHVPVQVSTLTGITAISAGFDHALALKNDSTVWAWGNNGFGQLGDGSNTTSNIPVQADSLTGIKAIAAGASTSLALKNDGTAWAFGQGGYGQFGNGKNVDSKIRVLFGYGVLITAIAEGDGHSIVVKNDSTVWTCGWNPYGELGDGTFNPNSSNVLVPVVAMCLVANAGCQLFITTQPVNQTAVSGSNVQFTVTSSDTISAYQWQANSGAGFVNISNTGQYTGANSNTLTVSNVSTPNDNQKFRCIINLGACVDTSNFSVLSVTPTGVSSIEQVNKFSIYPNPAADEIVIQSASTIQHIKIMNVFGQAIKSLQTNSKNVSVSLVGLSAGIYFIQINNSAIPIKLIKTQ